MTLSCRCEVMRKHDIERGADCWCEPIVVGDDVVGRVFIHRCDVCENNPCICPENIIGDLKP